MRPFSLLALVFSSACSTDKLDAEYILDDTGDIAGSASTDCDRPDAPENCNTTEGNCSDAMESGTTPLPVWYEDRDGDGYAGSESTVRACVAPTGFHATADDCDDEDPGVHPEADEGCDLVDTDCDGQLGAQELDGDGDGFPACEECDDSRATSFPGAAETCNGHDDDCDGDVDETAFYPDRDGDRFGDASAAAVSAPCWDPPEDHVMDNTDCNDTVRWANPEGIEVCDLHDVDEDCDGLADDLDTEAQDKRLHYPDGDGDGYGDAVAAPEAFCDPPPGFTTDHSDCVDSDRLVYPGSARFEPPGHCVFDHDGDGFGDPEAEPPADPGADCDDHDPGIHPRAAEIWYDGVDGDCDGNNDFDADLDGHLSERHGGDDCDDAAAGVNPSQAEVCDALGIDEDCNGLSEDNDPDVTGTTPVAPDQDGDGHGDSAAWELWCTAPTGWVGLITDCDDTDATVHPGVAEAGTSLWEDAACDGWGGHLDRADASFTGESSYNYVGEAVSSAGDVDGDGLDDLLIGAPNNDGGGTYAGAVYVVLAVSLDDETAGWPNLGAADLMLTGETSYDLAGSAVASAGDVDGDGLDDILIGAPDSDDAASSAGKVYLVLGSSLATTTATTGLLDLSTAHFSFTGDRPGDSAGKSVSSAGDVDGDGLDDILIGAPGSVTSAGAACVFLGSSLAAAGSTELSLTDADHCFTGEASGDDAGASVASAGDVDGDGLGDILVGAPNNDDGGTDAGKAYLLLGASLASMSGSSLSLASADLLMVGEAVADTAGTSLASAGDVDGDGLHDILIGAPSRATLDSGRAYLLLGSSVASTGASVDLSTADFTLVGEEDHTDAGTSVASAGDVDGDGYDDLLIGESDATSSTPAGRAHLVLASTLELIDSAVVDLAEASLRLDGVATSDETGTAVAGAGDVDGDGLADILIGAPDNDDGGTNAGRVFLVRGAE